ncbi:hypothetical protein [Streptomyces omiyaensis]|uniref:Uncharacterized protein n=1 Tax=Streptomyces omiyaensis TaxID=68247 RepID=A0ABW7BQU5_9ACTN|nr:hypothetical protein [Streptomyces omiyaensis]GGY26549.1 hypothetical protein GCM10010363_03940 [Streptomyces omiyaensis]
MSRLRPLVVAVLLLGLTGCASAVDPLERLGRKAVERVGDRAPAGSAVRAEAATE